MKKSIKAIIVAVLALVIVLSLTACATVEPPKTEATQLSEDARAQITPDLETSEVDMDNKYCFPSDDEDDDVPDAEYLTFSDNLTYDETEVREQFATQKALCIALDGASDYVVVISDAAFAADSDLKRAATYFADTLSDITGATTIAVYSDGTAPSGKKYFYFGDTASSSAVDTSSLPEVDNSINDSFVTVSDNNGNIFVKGLNDNGTENGIYAFLETYLEVMYCRNDFTYIPSLPTVYLDNIALTVSVPDFDWRMVHYAETWTNTSYGYWNERLQLSGNQNNGARTGWGTGWCHTAINTNNSATGVGMPVSYFDEHPEYFALLDNVRADPRDEEYKKYSTQLCYSTILEDPDAYGIIRDALGRSIAANPDKLYFDFSMMDNHLFCECDRCKEINEEQGSEIGAMIRIVNKLAKEFENVIITTLAYFEMVTPPATIVCEPNVQITLCTMKFGQFYSYLEGDNEKAVEFREVIAGWNAICEHILIWDYAVDFHAYAMPYPNFAVQADNVKLYKDNGVTAVFHQCVSQTTDSDMAQLKAYYLARQLWDIDVDVEELIGKYLVVTYGDAAPYVAQYLDELMYNSATEGTTLDLYDSVDEHEGDYLSREHIEEYLGYMDQAYEAAEGNATLTSRIDEIELTLQYAITANTEYSINERKAAYYEFKELASKCGLTCFAESNGTAAMTRDGDTDNYLHNSLSGDFVVAVQKALLKIAGASSIVIAICAIVKLM